jgi:hypothetical protein
MKTIITLEYLENGINKTFSCHGWSIYMDWMPYDSTEPIKMTVKENGLVKEYTKFEMKRREKCMVAYTQIIPTIG